jgi:hypothetical protein
MFTIQCSASLGAGVQPSYCVFAIYSPIIIPCSPRPQAAKPSSSPASGAAAMCRLAGTTFHSSPSLLSAPSAAGCAGTCHRRSFSVALTNSWFTSSGPEADSASEVECGLLTDDRKNSLGLVAKNGFGQHYIYERFSRRRWDTPRDSGRR